ncbi:hypothetical protein L596_015517 [Steinernema carpocapsae]|uniref:B9 domain-containing protein 1 n=1 Tax=Steinernema carpocapsae TaxID=34508 RepID=A0A4V6A352_STECR|nr:hypothetical protein L596_015517 [Steinernema carpocapsae]
MAQPSTSSSFLLMITGQIETADFPAVNSIYCKYSYVFGPDWSQIGGVHEAISSTCEKGEISHRITLSLPIEATFSSTSPHRWPQIVLSCYGPDFFNNDVIRGYGAVHLPTTPGTHERKVPMFVPEASTKIQEFLGYLTGKRPEFVDPKIVGTHEGREATRVRTQGLIKITFNAIIKDIKQSGYDVLPYAASRLIDLPSSRDFQEDTYLKSRRSGCNHVSSLHFGGPLDPRNEVQFTKRLRCARSPPKQRPTAETSEEE